MTVEMRNGTPAVNFKSADALSQRNGKVALAYGVTTVRNPGGRRQPMRATPRVLRRAPGWVPRP
jgi:hypothetical protein